jgi:hypothetical protein
MATSGRAGPSVAANLQPPGLVAGVVEKGDAGRLVVGGTRSGASLHDLIRCTLPVGDDKLHRTVGLNDVDPLDIELCEALF